MPFLAYVVDTDCTRWLQLSFCHKPGLRVVTKTLPAPKTRFITAKGLSPGDLSLLFVGRGVEKSGASLGFYVNTLTLAYITAATPGYGGYTPNLGIYTIIAGFEAIFGTFMWAAFIATFIRKYLRT